jgi:Peptidase C13 family
MDGFSVRTSITLADWHALQTAWAHRFGVQGGLGLYVIFASVIGALTYGALTIGEALKVQAHGISIVIGIVLGAAVVVARGVFLRRAVQPDPDGSTLGEQVMAFSVDGMQMERKGTDVFMRWSQCKGIDVTPAHIFIWTDRISAVIVPVRDLPDGLSAKDAGLRLQTLANAAAKSSVPEPATPAAHEANSDLAATCATHSAGDLAAATHHGQAGSRADSATPGMSAAPPVQATRLQATPAALQQGISRDAGAATLSTGAQASAQHIPLLAANLGHTAGLLDSVVRLWTLRKLRGSLPALSDWLFALGITGVFTLWFVLNWSAHEPEAEFFPYGVPNVAWYALLGFALAWVVSRRSYPAVEFRAALFALVALAPVVILASALVDQVVPEKWSTVANLLIAGYAIAYLARGAQAVGGGRPQIPVGAAALLFIGATSWFNAQYELSPSLWLSTTADEERGDIDSTWERSEALLFDQPSRIDAMVTRIEPATAADKPQVYFVGFAGVGEQRVFAEEIKLAAYNVGQRYGSSGRSILLLNDRRDLDKAPLATVSGLRRALKGIASRMNPERDVLFLALSSHGSDDPELSVSNGMLPLQQLNGATLASALRDSGIKHKVIVISACHAGAFIEPLKDENTVILTAAAADRTSFGCSDDRDLTYFGEAFYRDALPSTKSLREAFTQAARNIEVREHDEDMKPSKPQAFYGSATGGMLSEIEP